MRPHPLRSSPIGGKVLNLSHYPIFTGWRASRGLVDVITGAISIRWRLKFRGASLLTTIIALVSSNTRLVLVVVPSLLSLAVGRDRLVAVLRLLLSLVLVLRIVGCSAVTWGGVADPAGAVEWLQASLATPSCGKAAGGQGLARDGEKDEWNGIIPKQEEEHDERDDNHGKENPSSPGIPCAITVVDTTVAIIASCHRDGVEDRGLCASPISRNEQSRGVGPN